MSLRIMGFDVKVGSVVPPFSIVVWFSFVILGTKYTSTSFEQAAIISIPLTIFLTGVLLGHELAHALTASKLGLEVDSIRFEVPLVGIALVKDILEEKPWKIIVVALAGPSLEFSTGILALAASTIEVVPIINSTLRYMGYLMLLFASLHMTPLLGDRLMLAKGLQLLIGDGRLKRALLTLIMYTISISGVWYFGWKIAGLLNFLNEKAFVR